MLACNYADVIKCGALNFWTMSALRSIIVLDRMPSIEHELQQI